ncbi:MAG: hypothetical protein HYX97_03180, partial [Chloroflexi bacterium]|nr:hypothetical protein [Chloroflexota bacterium]
TITFLVAESGVKVSGRGIVDDGTAELLGRRYQRFTAHDVRPDSRIELRLDGLAYPQTQDYLRWGIIGGGLAVGALVLVFLLRRASRRAEAL